MRLRFVAVSKIWIDALCCFTRSLTTA